MEKKVNEVMRHSVPMCPLEASAKDVARIMSKENSRIVVVIDRTGEAWGVIAESDLIEHIDDDLEKISAEDILTESIVTIPPDVSISEAANVMNTRKVNQLVIMHADPKTSRPVGIIFAGDIVKEMGK